MRDLRAALRSKEVLVADGGMATSLYDKGFYLNRSFEELCLTNPEAVREVTTAFRQAGAQLLSTNSFNASIPKLTQFGMQDQLGKILKAAVAIAKEAAQDQAWVMGSIGPVGVVLEPLGPTSISDAQEMFRSNATILNAEGVDGFSLETFHDLNELEIAVRAVQSVSSKPIVAYLSVEESFKTSFGHSLREFVKRMESLNVDAIGLNCHLGPSELYDALEALRPLTKLPISILPNAGVPRFVNDRYMYLCNPDYMGKYAKRFIQAGAQIIGGCCGTTASHIKAISNAVRMLQPQATANQPLRARIDTPAGTETIQPKKLEERSSLGAALARKEKVITVELNPPKGVSVQSFMGLCQQLKDGGIRFVNIPDGARAMARMSSLHLAGFVKRTVGLEPIPHFTTRDRNLLGLQADLLGAYVNGVRNILLVTGDPPKLGNCPDATAVYDVDAIGLTHIVSRMNHGLDLGGSPFGEPAQFVINVALNPTSINPDLEIDRFNYKIDAGAEVAITQPIYDLPAYHRFFEKRGRGPEIPVIMGIWPLVSLRNAEFLKYEVPGVHVPDWVIAEMEKAGDNQEEALKRGLDIARRTMEEAKPFVAGFQVSAPFNRVSVVLDLIRSVSS